MGHLMKDFELTFGEMMAMYPSMQCGFFVLGTIAHSF